MKSTEMNVSLKGLAGITVDSTRANNSKLTKAFVRIVLDGKVYATSSLSRPLQTSPTEKNNAKIKRHVALWDDNEMVMTRDGELQIWLRLPSGKDQQIGAGSLKMPAKGGATDVKLREVRRNYGSPYRLDASSDAKLRMHITWQETEAGKESPASKIAAPSSSVAIHHSGFEISPKETLQKSLNRELNVEALNEPEVSPTRPDPPSIEVDSFEPSVEQVFVPKTPDQPKDVNDMSEQKSKNLKKKSPFAKLMGWGRSKKAYDSLPPVQSRHKTKEAMKAASPVPAKQVKDAIPKTNSSAGNITTPKKTVPEAKLPKQEELATPKRTVSIIKVDDERLITTPQKKTPSEAQLHKKEALTPRPTTPPFPIQNEQFSTPRKVEAVARIQRDEEATPKRTGGVAHARKDFETASPKMEPIAQTKKELFPLKPTDTPVNTEKVEIKRNSPRMDPPDSSPAWSTSTFEAAQKEVVAGPERSHSSMTRKMANSNSTPPVRLSESIQSSSSEQSPQLFMFSTPKADFRLRSKSNDNDGFEQLDVSFPTPDFSRHTTPRMGSKQLSSQPTVEEERSTNADPKPLSSPQNDKVVSASRIRPAKLPPNDQHSSHARQQQQQQQQYAPVTRTPTRDMDDYSLFSEDDDDDDSTFLAKPKQIFGLIKCCIMGDEDSIYGFDETLTFDETLGDDTVDDSYDDTISSDLPTMNDWWCQGGFGGRSQTSSVLRRRQIWKERMQQLAEQNGDVKELFESGSEAGSTRAGDDDEDTATATNNEQRQEPRLQATNTKEKVENCTLDSANSEAFVSD
ncbi:hypothetical protein FisN_27Lh089 [Fistulifera solaris]|uniref:Uncharacterized protein n=1 Tax=Fistulifera solaris TaxID=1519565 RepID=A0A1Z5KAN8_FISSO|nr:hypothetical protein FisN_27Lh089 [Fistulifera solaris]|eukprot:GAX23314.1 hypothetical protein FisN_27Lh089 [Fistulifera solaris]